MFLIFGIKRKAQRIASVFALCGSCRTPAAQVVVRIRVFFSLFFVPIIPLGSTYRSTCTMCGRTVRITKEAATQPAGQAGQTAPQSAPFGPLQPQPAAAPLPGFSPPSMLPQLPAFRPPPPPPPPAGGFGSGNAPPPAGL